MPLSRRVIFSDWHGVLCRDPFWVSIRGSAAHPLHAQLEAGLTAIFASGQDTANDWMKGLLSSDQVIAEMGIQLDRRFGDDFLARRLDIDCARMAVNAGLFEVLRAIRAEALPGVHQAGRRGHPVENGRQRHQRSHRPAPQLARPAILRKRWVTERFTVAQIDADPALWTQVLVMPRG